MIDAIPEKQENCPDCNKALGQAEYDGQFCETCGTQPFGFFKIGVDLAAPGTDKTRRFMPDPGTCQHEYGERGKTEFKGEYFETCKKCGHVHYFEKDYS